MFTCSHDITSPTARLRVGVIRHIDFVLVAVDKEAPRPPLPLVVDLGHRDHPHLVPLSQDLLLGELGGVAGHQLGRGHLDHLVIKTLNWEHALALLLIRDLAAVKKHCISMLCYCVISCDCIYCVWTFLKRLDEIPKHRPT